MAEVIPDAEARPVPDAGHTSHVDNPEFILEALRAVLADVALDPPDRWELEIDRDDAG